MTGWRSTGARAAARSSRIRTDGTRGRRGAGGVRHALGWGVAGHVRFPMRWLSEGFGPDELLGMAYYGEGIGRYFAGSTTGQDALTNIGLPGVTQPGRSIRCRPGA